MDGERSERRRGVHWPTFWAAVVGVGVLLIAGWFVMGRMQGSDPEPPPQESLEDAPGPDNRARSLPDPLPEGAP